MSARFTDRHLAMNLRSTAVRRAAQAHQAHPGPFAGDAVRRWGRPLAVGVTLVLLAVFAMLSVARWQAFAAAGYVGVDFDIYRLFAERFLDSGSMYLPHQLAGPFDPQPWRTPAVLPSMYPPHAVYLFAPFLVLPAVLWWAVPLGVIGYALMRWRPAYWTWPLLALLGLNPDAVSAVIVGNTTTWLVAFVAAGFLWGWPAVLVTLKPSLLPFALIGLRHRSWWVAAVLMAVVSLPLAGEWFAYLAVVRNAETSLAYSLGSLPVLALPVVAWLGRTHARPAATSPRQLRA